MSLYTAASSDAPSTPSGAKPVYEKPNKQDSRRGRKKRGAKVGHKGAHRAPPVEIDRRKNALALVHLLRELKKVDQYLDTSEDWQAFRKKLKRLIQDAIRLCHRRDELSAEKYTSLKDRIEQRLDKMLSDDWANKNATRLVKRLRKYRPYVFTFLKNASVPYENNFAKREIRPAVLHRKNSYGNRSNDGSRTQSVLMSIFRTLKQRNLKPIDTIVTSLREYCQSGKLLPLPRPKT